MAKEVTSEPKSEKLTEQRRERRENGGGIESIWPGFKVGEAVQEEGDRKSAREKGRDNTLWALWTSFLLIQKVMEKLYRFLS